MNTKFIEVNGVEVGLGETVTVDHMVITFKVEVVNGDRDTIKKMLQTRYEVTEIGQVGDLFEVSCRSLQGIHPDAIRRILATCYEVVSCEAVEDTAFVKAPRIRDWPQ